MIIGDVDIEVIELFSRDLARFYSINEISRMLRKRYPYVNKRVNLLIKEGVLSKRNLGASYLCYLNLRSTKTLALLTLVWADKQKGAKLKLNLEGMPRGCDCILYVNGQLIAVSETPVKGAKQLSDEEFLAYLKKEGARGIIPLQGYEWYIREVIKIESELRMGRLDL